MKRYLHGLLVIIFIVIGFNAAQSQGLPPGWDYNATPSNHIISLPLTAEPNINGYLLNPGDYIGVFYTDDDGNLVCGGATDWLGDQNTGIIAFGDDAFTTEKDGFDSGEVITYKFFSWSVEKEYEADVICNDSLPVACDIFVPNGLSGVDSIWANGYYIVASASPDSVCSGSEVQLLVEPSGGSGNYSYNWSSDPSGFSSDLPNPTSQPSENTTYFVSVQDGDETLQTSVSIEVFPEPFADAGPDITVCEDSTVTVTGNYENSSSFFWITNGDGVFNNINVTSPDYTPGPGDIQNGGVELSFIAEAIEPCTVPAVSTMEISITGLPQVEIGVDQTVCENQTVNLSATLLNAIELLWTTSGDGTFENPGQIETVYFSGTSDLITGQVDITVTVQAFSPCQGQESDQLSLYFEYLPEVNAGDDQVICEVDDVQLAGNIGNTESFSWETLGDGTFDDPLSLETVYYPGNIDISTGEVELSLFGEAISPCNGQFSDLISVLIISEPTVNAGDDASICETGNLQLNGEATNFEEVFWSTDGDGTFSDNNSINTTYFPGEEDIASQEVEIQLAAQPLYPCIVQATDIIYLLIEHLPTANAGEDFTIPLEDTYLAQGEATNYSSVLWATTGDGTFENQMNLETNYYPGSGDIAIAGTALVLTANPINPCITAISDELMLTIDTVTYVHSHILNSYISIYPNPTNGLIYVDYQKDKNEFFKIYVYDDLGRCIIKKSFMNDNFAADEKTILDLSSHDPGLYIIEVNNGNNKYFKKVFLYND